MGQSLIVGVVAVKVYDVDSSNTYKLSDHDFLGRTTLSLADIVTSPGQTVTVNLVNKRNQRLRAGSTMTIGYHFLSCFHPHEM